MEIREEDHNFFVFYLEEWNETEIEALTQAIAKFNYNWTQIADYVQRSKESCQAFYMKQYKTTSPIDVKRKTKIKGNAKCD